MSRNVRLIIVYGMLAAAVVAVFFMPPIEQDSSYHHFADKRQFFGVPRALNVLSNLPFLFIGLWGMRVMLDRCTIATRIERTAYFILALGVTLTCLGSAYYHADPSNARLVWDRLPMSLAFVTLSVAVVSERISQVAGRLLLWPLLLAGLGSVAYWRWTEAQQHGDLRAYVLVQFLPLLAIPAIILLFPAKHTHTGYIFIAIGFYTSAKAMEALDHQVYDFTGFVSGHTIKHLLAAAAAWWLIRMVQVRQPAQQ